MEVPVEEEVVTPPRGTRRNPIHIPDTPRAVAQSLQIIQEQPELAAFVPAMILSIERGCGPYEAQKFADSLREGADVGNEAVHIIQGLVRAFNKALNIKDSEMSAQIRSAVTAALSQPRPVPSVSGPTPQERATRRKMLNERLPTLVKGTSVAHWIETVTLIIRQDGTGLTPSEILDAVKKAACANSEVALNIDSNIAGKLLTDVSELFLVLTKLFKPDQHGYLAALRSKLQRENQSAADFMNEINDLGYKHWIGLPDKEEVFEMIISAMSDKHHRPFMRLKLETMHVAMQAQDNPKPVTLANLLTWALDSDAEFAANLLRQKRTNSAQGAKVNNSQGDSNDKRNFQDNRSSNYRGRGRGNGRGYANYNQPFEEKSPF
eukprot:jgi/Botrbrau1/14752/Bobra.0103s0002.1